MAYIVREKSPKGRYHRFDEKIGSGAYKEVYKAYDIDLGIYVAWNIIHFSKLNDTQKKLTRDELKILISLKQRHPNILNVRSSWYNKEKNSLIFITDLYLSGDLRSFVNNVKTVKVKVIKKWCQHILHGVKFLHDNNIIHRDLKCSNLYVNGTDGNIVIGDFGIARITSTNGMATTVVGTPEFMAPEIYNSNYTIKSDIYAFGMCLLEISTNMLPYNECDNVAQIWKRVHDKKKPESFESVSVSCIRELINRCINSNPDKRPTVDEILEDSFFEKTEFDDIVIDFHNKSDTKSDTKSVEEEIQETLELESHLEELVDEDEVVSTSSSNSSLSSKDLNYESEQPKDTKIV